MHFDKTLAVKKTKKIELINNRLKLINVDIKKGGHFDGTLLSRCLYENGMKNGMGQVLSHLQGKSQAGQFSVRKLKQENELIN